MYILVFLTTLQVQLQHIWDNCDPDEEESMLKRQWCLVLIWMGEVAAEIVYLSPS